MRRRAEPPVVAVDHDGLADARRPRASSTPSPKPTSWSSPPRTRWPASGRSSPCPACGPRWPPAARVPWPSPRGVRPAAGHPSGTGPGQGPGRLHGRPGPRARATEVAAGYADLVGRFVLDRRDSAEATAIEKLGLEVLLADTLAPPRERAGLAKAVVEFGLHWARVGPCHFRRCVRVVGESQGRGEWGGVARAPVAGTRVRRRRRVEPGVQFPAGTGNERLVECRAIAAFGTGLRVLFERRVRAGHRGVRDLGR